MINIYDFDGTIYDGDSTVDFFFFCLRKKPYIILLFPLFIICFLLYYFGFISKTKMKENFYLFLRFFPNIDSEIKMFWEKNSVKIKKYYLDKKKHDDDVIISASPYFLLKPICDKLKVKKLIASNVDKKSGKYDGVNCHGEEKVRRLNLEFKKVDVNEVYSDSYSDLPIFKLGKKAYMVKKDNLTLIDAKNIVRKKPQRLSNTLCVIYTLCLVCASLFFSADYNLSLFKYLIILSVLFGFLSFIVFKKVLFNDFNKKYYLYSLIFCLYLVSLEVQYSSNGIVYASKLIPKIFGFSIDFRMLKFLMCLGTLFCLSIFVYYLLYYAIPFVKKEYKIMSLLEKRFLLILLIVGSVVMFFVYNRTNIFYKPMYKNNSFVYYDALYTTDSGGIIDMNVYGSVWAGENDFRQSLFGVFAMPVYVVSSFIASFLSFVPCGYYVVLGVVQLMLLGLCIIMVERMINLKKDKLLFYIFACSTYTMIVFPLIFEQYIIALFYLILAIYIGFFEKMKVNYLYCGAVGTLITSGIIFPLISKAKGIFNWLADALKCFLAYVFLMILSGQYLQVFGYVNSFKSLMRFTGKNVIFKDRLLQFLSFVRSMFYSPKTKLIILKGSKRFWLADVKIVSIIGIIILLLCFISFIINRKEKFAVISFLWIVFSFLILCVFGWGTQENGLILYSLYFCWAYCSLLMMLFDKIKNKKIKYCLFAVIVLLMLIGNINGLVDIVKFGMKYYYL